MNRRKVSAVLGASLLIAVLTVGARSGRAERPRGIPLGHEIPLGPDAGFVLTAKPGRPHAWVDVKFNVETHRGWRWARVENPAYVEPVQTEAGGSR